MTAQAMAHAEPGDWVIDRGAHWPSPYCCLQLLDMYNAGFRAASGMSTGWASLDDFYRVSELYLAQQVCVGVNPQTYCIRGSTVSSA
jgi:hypothetical protein